MSGLWRNNVHVPLFKILMRELHGYCEGGHDPSTYPQNDQGPPVYCLQRQDTG